MQLNMMTTLQQRCRNIRFKSTGSWRCSLTIFFQPVFGKMLIPRFWFNRQIVSNVNLKRKKYLDAILLFFNPYNKCLLWKWAKLESKKWVKKKSSNCGVNPRRFQSWIPTPLHFKLLKGRFFFKHKIFYTLVKKLSVESHF